MPSFATAGYKPPVQKKEKKPPKPPRPKKKHKGPSRIAVISVFVFILAVLLSAGVLWIYSETRDYSNTFLPGIFVSGEPLMGMTLEQATERLRKMEQSTLEDFSYTLECDEEAVTLTSEDLEMSFDISGTLEPLFALGKDGGMIRRYLEIRRLNAEPVFATPTLNYNLNTAEQAIAEFVESYECDPVSSTVRYDPSLDAPFIFTDDIPGIHVDTRGALEAVRAACIALESGTHVIETEQIESEVTRAELEDQIRILNRQSFLLSQKGSGAANAELALLQLDGVRIDPGKTFSFNETVGERTEENGYITASEPAYGLDVTGVGGGICEASSILYQSAILSGLRIEERTAAAVLVDFAVPGEEAAVSDQGLDLVILNDTDIPLFLHCIAYDTDEGKNITIEWFGKRGEAARYRFEHEVDILDAPTEPVYVLDKEGIHAVYSDERVLRNNAIDGKIVATYRVSYDANGAEIGREKLSEDRYEPIPECIWVGALQRDAQE